MKVQVEFDLNEDVTPELFAVKVALACAKGGAIREGESVTVVPSGIMKLDGSGRYMNKFEYVGDILTDMGGVLSKSIVYPNLKSSLTGEE